MNAISNSQLQTFQRKLAYQFSDLSLLRLALTHRSADKTHNQRLEFLGDAALGLCMAEWLFLQFPNAPEGELSQLRASLVNRHSLADIARQLDLGPMLVLGLGEQKSGGRQRDSILSDAMEAVLGAVYLDSGMDTCHRVIRTIFARHLPVSDDGEAPDTKDAKTRLQEIMQARGVELPRYEVEDVRGDEHDQMFFVRCITPLSDAIASGSGRTRREAEQLAAQQALDILSRQAHKA